MERRNVIGFVILIAVLVLAVVAYIIIRALLNPAKPPENTGFNILPTTTIAGLTAPAETATPLVTPGAIATSAPPQPAGQLTLTVTASPQTFGQVGQTITYTYTITNSGSVPIGPDQFIVTDTGLGIINCGDANTTLAPGQSLTCTATHVVTQADLDAGSLITSATVSGGGAQASFPASVTVTKSAPAPAPAPLPVNPANLTQGTTIQHTVAAGEWLWQIARCYGADPKQVVQANSQLPDVDLISPGTIVNVPDIGSKGTIYGPPCTTTYTVQAGDTWSSIAQAYDADPVVLQKANPGALLAGSVLVVPLHSAQPGA